MIGGTVCRPTIHEVLPEWLPLVTLVPTELFQVNSEADGKARLVRL